MFADDIVKRAWPKVAIDVSGESLQELVDRLVPTLPAGLLDAYRDRASFNWKVLKVIWFLPDNVEFENKVWHILTNDSVFTHTRKDLNLDETRRLTFLRCQRLKVCFDKHLPSMEEMMIQPGYLTVLMRCLGLYDWSIYIKFILSNAVFRFTLLTLGQTYHYDIYERFDDENLVGCLALTELAHGSNLQKLQTEAVYDANTEEFVIHSPSLESVKCWSGNLGHHATHAMLYAQLYTSDGICHGLHSFVIPVRDSKTRLPFAGVIIGDMGAKAGLNGIDNGFMQFNRYRVPRQCLLNRFSDVTSDGKFVSAIKDSRSRFGATLGGLSGARCAISIMCILNLSKALVIAVRYSAVRRQFGSTSLAEENPIWEYELQRWRLIPYIGAVYVLDGFSRYISEIFRLVTLHRLEEQTTEEKVSKIMMAEMHSISCGLKAVTGWLARDGIQECREACGGHGYLKIAGLGDIRNDHDANLTYEGDNNVLTQQTAHYLLVQLQATRSGEVLLSPLRSCDYLNDIEQILKSRWIAFSIENVLNVEVCLSAYKWLVCYLLQESAKSLEAEIAKGSDRFTAFSNCQVFRFRTLSLVYIEHMTIEYFYKYLNSSSLPGNIRGVLHRLCCLFGLWCLQKHFVYLYEGGFVSCSRPSQLVKQAILQLCSEVKCDAISLVDVFAPPDNILNSALGVADGQIYKSLYGELIQRSGVFEQPSWWKEVQETATKDLSSKL